MEKEEFKNLYKKYGPIFGPMVEKIIKDDCKYLMLNQRIQYSFGYDDEISIMGTCDRKTGTIHLNLLSLIHAYNTDNFIDVEYFIIHELRHTFQHKEIEKYENNQDVVVDTDIIKNWICEFNNYVTALDSNGEENDSYFKQDCEIDAYAFSYALMKYKYGDEKIAELYVPTKCGNEFGSFVEQFIDFFKDIDNQTFKDNKIEEKVE